jgi:nicotinate-nucleotide adenylyltransferase
VSYIIKKKGELHFMTIGVLGGSFCPPTIAHVELSKMCVKQGLCDKIIWVPVNDAYRKETNIPAKHRVAMVELAIANEPVIECSLHEMDYNEVVYTIDTLKILRKLYPNDKILFIAGADKMGYKWFRREEMVRDFGYIVTSRGDVDCNAMIESSVNLTKYRDNIKIVNYQSDISSTMVRKQILTTGISDLVHPDVLKYIQENNLFK